MPWAKLDDRFHSHPKVREAWYRCPAAVGLQVTCITYAADQQTDGVVPVWFVAGLFQKPKDMEAAVETLTDLRMWHRPDDDCRCLVQEGVKGEVFLIHDFLDFHPSKVEREEKKAGEAQRKREAREEKKRAEEAADLLREAA